MITQEHIVSLAVTSGFLVWLLFKTALWVGRIPTRRQQAKERKQAYARERRAHHDDWIDFEMACMSFLEGG